MHQRPAFENLGRLACALFAILSVACQTPTSPQPQPKTDLTIVGQVIEDAPTLTPISDAVITVVDGPQAGLTAIADGNGRYALSGLTGTIMSISASSPAHEPRAYPVNPATTATLVFNLKPIFQLLTETVSGTISTHASYDDDGDVKEWSMPIHHGGTLTASLTWSPSSAVVGLGLARSSENPAWTNGLSGPPVVLTAPILAGSTYTLVVSSTRGPLPIDFTLVISRPN